LIAGPLLVHYGSWAISLMMAMLALASLASTWRLPETNRTSLSGINEWPAPSEVTGIMIR
jgi:hypothetical protein